MRLSKASLVALFISFAFGCESKTTQAPTHTSEDPSVTANRAALESVTPTSFETSNVGSLRIPQPSDAMPSQQAPLKVESLDVKVITVGRMARTEVTQVFRNHTDQETEGTYSFMLPEGASLSRLAMDVEGKMVEGELVEREKARRIYENIVNRKKDPALLEWQGNNRFSTQIFPIPARGTKTVVIAYEQLISNDTGRLAYDYALPRLSGQDAKNLAIDNFSFSMKSEDALALTEGTYGARVKQLGQGGEVSFAGKGFVPAGPLRVDFRLPMELGQRVLHGYEKGEAYFLADLLVDGAKGAITAPENLVIALDTSAGLGQPVVEHAAEVAAQLVSSFAAQGKVAIITGDLMVKTCGEQRAESLACLQGLEAGGASDLEALLKAAMGHASAMEGETEVLLISDGAASLGKMDGELLRGMITKGLPNGKTLHAVAIGHAPNEDGMRELARAGRGQLVRWTPGAAVEDALLGIKSARSRAMVEDLEIKVLAGEVKELASSARTHIASGEMLTVMGKSTGGATLEVSGQLAGKPWKREVKIPANTLTQETHALMTHFWARARIDELVRADAPRPDVVELSLAHGVLSPYTSYLVLENDEAFERYQIERRKERERITQKQQEQQAQGNLKKSSGDLKDVLADAQKAGESYKLAEVEEKEDSDEEMAKSDEMEPPAELAAVPGDGAFGQRGMGSGGGGVGDDFKDMPSIASSQDSPRVISMPRKKRMVKKKRAKSKNRLFIEDGNGRWEPDYASQIKSLLAQGEKTLLPRKHGQLIELYTANKQPERARQAFERATKVHKHSALEVLSTPALQQLYPAAYIKEGQAQFDTLLEAENTPALGYLADLLGRQKMPEEFLKTFGSRKLELALSGDALRNYTTHDPESFEKIWQQWEALYTARERHGILSSLPTRTGMNIPEYRFKTLTELVRAQEPLTDERLLEEFFTTATTPERASAASAHLMGYCKSAAGMSWCLEHGSAFLERLEDEEARAALHRELKTSYGDMLAQLRRSRSEDMGNISLITQHARLYELLGEPAKAQRVLSEIVEFSPHDYEARSAYAQLLSAQDRVQESCGQYATAVQLDASKRDTFKTMMKMRREHEDKAKLVRDCIVDGVSNLPVKRAISVVLTWEDPSADVDLHIQETQAGELVWYSDRESKIGGMLYYDITDGYGPEIYVLGSGPKGVYDFKVVYYSGDTPNLRGKLTILRNAGAPSETREDFDFVLPKADSSTKIPVTRLTFTDDDRSVDGSQVVAP